MCQEESSRLLEGLICGRSHLPVLKNVRDRSWAKTTTLLVFIQLLVKSLKNSDLLITLRNVNFFQIDSMLSGLLHKLQIFWQLHLIELVRLLLGLELLELWHLIHPRLLTGFGMLVFFTDFFSVTDGLRWFWMGSIQLMLDLDKAPFLVLHLSYYTLMTFLIMLSVILLFMLMTLFSFLSLTRHMVNGKH